jgi:hypothetical protein
MTKNLWPDFDLASSKPTPKNIIEQAGAGLEKKTNGTVRFHLGHQGISGETASIACKLYAPALSYMYPFLNVRFPLLDEYPVELDVDKVPETLHAKNQEELLSVLERIFQLPSTIDTIQKLIALSR